MIEIPQTMKKLLFTLIGLMITLTTYGSHILGGMVGVSQTSQDSTTVGVWLITDSQSPVPIPTTITVERWEMNSVGWYVQNGTVTLTKGTVTQLVQGQNLTNYSSDYLDLDSNKYRFIYKHCCWPVLSNTTNSSDFIISADYWHIPYNSTPFANSPININQEVGVRNTMKPMWGWNTFLDNPDFGDVVQLSQTDLHSNYSNGVFVPQVFNQISMHVDNDSISWIPNSLGNYATGFEITDYRNGYKIGTQRIQWTFKVVTSTLYIEEYTKSKEIIGVWDWQGRYMEKHIKHIKHNGLYVIRYNDGSFDKVLLMIQN